MNKYEEIIHLLSKNGLLTANQLSARLQLSVRTIKNYIRQINDSTPNTIISSNKGYSLNNSSTQLEISHANSDKIPQNSSERVAFIIKNLLSTPPSASLNIYDIAEELFVSDSTIRTDLKKVRRKCAKSDLELKMSGDNFYLLGTEQNKRRLLSDAIYHETNNKLINIHSLKDYFPDTDLYLIRSIIQIVFQENHYFINDYSLVNLVLHIALSIERIKNNKHHISQQVISENESADFLIASKIALQLELNYHVKFNGTEIYEIGLLIASRATSLNYENINIANIENFVGHQCVQMSSELIKKIKNTYSIDLAQPEFFIRFTLHLYNLQIRSKNNYLSKNPLTNEMKVTYPFIYDIAVTVAQVLTEKFFINLNDDEIAFIAFHIGSVVELNKESKEKLKTIIFCPEYYDLGIQLSNNIKSKFERSLIIVDLITEFEQLKQTRNIDFIISTLPIKENLQVATCEVNLFLTPKIEEMLENKIKYIQIGKRQEEAKKLLKKIIKPSLFHLGISFSTKEDCIHFLTDKLFQESYVSESFESEVLTREELSSTAFGLFAIPHSMAMNAHKTGLCIAIPSTPISWHDQKVNLVLMMCFNKNDRTVFNQIYETITMVLNDVDNFSYIIKSKDYNDFINRLASCIS